jgi:hypothetical protein
MEACLAEWQGGFTGGYRGPCSLLANYLRIEERELEAGGRKPRARESAPTPVARSTCVMTNVTELPG